MSKAPKGTVPTPEEHLQAVLVPDWEQPYKLPENWCWTRITNVSNILNGFAFKSRYYTSSGIRIIRITNVQDGFIQDEKPVYYPFERQKEITPFILKNGDILISLTGNVGRIAIINTFFLPAALNQRVACLRLKSEDSIRKKYLYYFFLQKQFLSDCIKSAKGSAQLNMSTEWLKNYPITLPPFAEQQRIINRIEILFTKLDKAKENALVVVNSLKTLKAAILYKAFTGALTAMWRKSATTPWICKKIKDCCKLGSGGTPSRKNPDFYTGNIPWIKTGEIGWNNIYDSEEQITQNAITNSSAKCYAPGAVLVAMYGMGATRGKAGILCVRAATNQAICVLEPKKDIIYNRYLLYYFMRNYWDIREKSVGGNQLNLSAAIIKELYIDIPPLNEQKEIVRILDRLFAKEQQIKESAQAVLDQIDLIKKSILSRAFRGELGTNDPTDEPAVKMLKRALDM